MEIKKQLIIGLPGTGKTTFLAALWQVVESEEVPGSLVVSQVHGLRDHLNRIREEWLKCKQLERTKIPAEEMVTFHLRNTKTDDVIELSLPDLSGETFQLQWENRQWTTEFEKLALESSGALIFVHPRTIIEPVRIDSTVEAMSAALVENNGDAESNNPVSGADNQPSTEETKRTEVIEPWSPANTPTQVKLVEIIQFLRNGPFVNRTLPIAIIVSAWDLITNRQTPDKWIESRLPLLYQFLQANAEEIPTAMFGVSAQGGELSQANELQKHIKASERIIVITQDQPMTHDITAPLKWLLER